MKKFLLRYFTYIAILYIVDALITGYEINSSTAMLVMSFLLTLALLIIRPILKFMTFPVNFFTFGTFNFFIACALTYLYNIIIPGFALNPGSLGPLLTSDVQIPEVKLSEIGVIILSSLFISVLNNIVNWTQDGKSKSEKE